MIPTVGCPRTFPRAPNFAATGRCGKPAALDPPAVGSSQWMQVQIAAQDTPALQLVPGPPRAVAALQAKASLESAREASEQARKTVESSLRELQEQNDNLRRKVLGMETQLKEYERLGENWEGSQARLKEKVTKLEVPGLRPFPSCPELFPCHGKEFEELPPCRQSAGRWRSRWAKPRSGNRSC